MAQYSMNEFRDWLSASCTVAAGALREFEEMRAAFAGEFLNYIVPEFQAGVQKLAADLLKLQSAGKLGEAGDAGVHFLNAVGVKKSEIAARLEKLKEILATREEWLLAVKAEHDKLVAKFLNENRSSNDAEEKQKLEVSRTEGAVMAGRNMAQSLSRGIGWIVNYFTIRKIKKELAKEIKSLLEKKEKLKNIRDEYIANKLKNASVENELAAEYDNTLKGISDVRSEQASLSGDRELTARAEAAKDIFAAAPENILNALRPAIRGIDEFVSMRRRFRQYDQSLKLVTEEVGFLKGIVSGLERISKTVDSLAEQGAKYSSYLPKLVFSLPGDCAAFPAAFEKFGAAVENEKALQKTPAEFIEKVGPFHKTHFNEQKVKGFFESLGSAIQKATAAWKA